MQYTEKQKSEAHKLYCAGEEIPAIAEQTGVGLRTLYAWIKKGEWAAVANRENTLSVIERRIWLLVNRENKTLLELFEVERLVGTFERLKKLEIQAKARTEAPSEKGEKRDKKRQKRAKNDFSHLSDEEIEEFLRDGLFEYQSILWDNRRQRTRNILKARQIGLTYYFAKEAFADALLTGRNKIFLSASRAQARIFQGYIKLFALEAFGVELLGGDQVSIITPHGVATFYFLSTNSATAQGYHGDVYIDEYFWIPSFAKLKKLAGAMAAQKDWSRTFLSTPSVTGHEAYPFWTGSEFNERNRKDNKKEVDFPTRKELRKAPRRCADGVWRWIITLDDAERMGCKLFNRDQLLLENSPEEFRQLYCCHFIDDSGSIFQYSSLVQCLGDAEEFPRGVDRRQVAIGYDPARGSRDGASIVVVAIPNSYKGVFYVLEKITLHNTCWSAQAEIIKELCQKYDVRHITIDRTGEGSGVFEMVEMFFPAAEGIMYNLERKTKLVLKMQQVVNAGRIRWDASYSDIAAGLLQIKRGVSSGGGKITYYAERTANGHADAAWALMHALEFEGLILPEDAPASEWD